MKIQKDTAITLSYKVADAKGKFIEEAKEPMTYLHGGYDNTLPKIEAALEGKEVGHTVTLQLLPEDAFGQRDESLDAALTPSPEAGDIRHHPQGQRQGRHHIAIGPDDQPRELNRAPPCRHWQAAATPLE